jgi:hypothetical protein
MSGLCPLRSLPAPSLTPAPEPPSASPSKSPVRRSAVVHRCRDWLPQARP